MTRRDESRDLTDDDKKNLDRDLLDAFLESAKGMDPKEWIENMEGDQK